MNLFLHGVEDFHIERGTLLEIKFVEGGTLKQFDLVLANPPYSIKQWDRAKRLDKWGRNKYGTPPQGNADYAFFQHIIASTKPTRTVRYSLPSWNLFRDQEKDMREKIVAADLVSRHRSWSKSVLQLADEVLYRILGQANLPIKG